MVQGSRQHFLSAASPCRTDVINGLIQRLARGDQRARDELLSATTQRLSLLVQKELRHFPAVQRWEQTDDVLQGVLVRLARALAEVPMADARHFFALSAALIRRELIDLKRHYYGPEGGGAHHATRAPPRGDSDTTEPPAHGDQTLDPERLALWTEFHQRIEKLPAGLREVVDLVWYQGLTHEEAAVVLGVASKTIARRWREARLTLGEAIVEQAAAGDQGLVVRGTMELNTKIHDLLSIWEHQGKKATPEELCANQPELVETLREAMGRLARVDPVVKELETPQRQAVITVPGYELVRELGGGGQGVVYLAKRTSIDRMFAIKVLRSAALATAQQMSRFEREARIVAALKHPGIVTAIDFGTSQEGAAYLVMDYIDGQALDEHAKSIAMHETREGLRAGLGVFSKVCDAVGAAHVRGIIHRDLKPSNIRVDNSGQPYVLDFGLARTAFDAVGSAAQAALTMSGQFLGTLPWSSPEQATGEWDNIDTRTDVYSLGIILYQLVTGGQFPYDVRGSLFQVVQNIRSAEPTPPSVALRKGSARRRRMRISLSGPLTKIDSNLEAIIMMALAKNRERRYHSAHELGRDVDAYLQGATPAAAAKFRRRRAVRAILSVAIVALGFGATAYIAYRWPGQAAAPATQTVIIVNQAASTAPATPPDPRPGFLSKRRGELAAAQNLVQKFEPLAPQAAGALQSRIAELETQLTNQLEGDDQKAWSREMAAATNEQMGQLLKATQEVTKAAEQGSADAASGWIKELRGRAAVNDGPGDERSAAIDKAWVAWRDGRLAGLDATLEKVLALKVGADGFFARGAALLKALPPAPTIAATPAPTAAAGQEALTKAWQALLAETAGSLGDGSAGGEAGRGQRMEGFRQVRADIDNALSLESQFQTFLQVARQAQGLDEKAWSAARDAVAAGTALSEKPPAKDLMPDLALSAALWRAHTAGDLAGLDAMVKESESLELLLECSRRAAVLSGGEGAIAIPQMGAALDLHRRLGKFLEGRGGDPAADALRKDLDRRLVGQLVRWGRAGGGGGDDFVALVDANKEWLPLADDDLKWLRLDLFVRQIGRDGAPANPDELKKIEGQWIDLAAAVQAEAGERLRDSLHPISVGPDAKIIREIEPGRLGLTLNNGRDAATPTTTLEFVLVHGAATGDFYLATTEITIEDFCDMVSAAQGWDDMATLLPAPAAGRPWCWAWDPNNPRILTAPAGIPNGLKVSVSTGEEAMLALPMTYVTPAAACFIARKYGCRLPTPREWQAALAQAMKEAGGKEEIPQLRLRGQAWMDQLPAGARAGMWLDEGIFLPRTTTAIGQHEKAGAWNAADLAKKFGAMVRGADDHDPSALFRRIDYKPNHCLKDIVGNVAELVLDESVHCPAPPLAARDLVAWAQHNDERICVMGGSALSPPELDPTVAQPVSLAKGAVGYSDVGFRLAFDSKNVAAPLRFKSVLQQFHYIGPGEHIVYDQSGSGP